jgi:hypothetical protein
MARLHFQCPKTGGWFSATFENVQPDGQVPGLVIINRCRFCGDSHRYKRSEIHRSRPAGVKNPKVPAKKNAGYKTRTMPLYRAPKVKNPCFGSLSEADQQRAADEELSSTLFMLEAKLRCLDCGALVGAQKSAMGSFYVPSPRPHEKPKPQRPRPLKRGPRK